MTEKQDNIYWKPEVQDKALVAYSLERDAIKRGLIYNQYLHKPLLRLTEAVIKQQRTRLSFIKETNEELQYELISMLLERLPKWSPERGTAFTFFTLLSTQYLITKNKDNDKFSKWHVVLDDELETEELSNYNQTYEYEDNLPYTDEPPADTIVNARLQYFKDNISLSTNKYGTAVYHFILDNVNTGIMEDLPNKCVKKETCKYLYELCNHAFDERTIYNVLSMIIREYKFIRTSAEPRYVEHRKQLERKYRIN